MINNTQIDNQALSSINTITCNQRIDNKQNKIDLLSVQFADLQTNDRDRVLQDIKATSLPAIDRYVKPIEVSSSNRADLCEAVRKLDWKAPIFTQDSQFPHYALAAYQSGELSSAQLSTVLLYFSLLKYHQPEDIKSVSLFDEKGVVNLEAAELLKLTFKVPKDSIIYLACSKEDVYLTNTQFERFLEALKQASPSEQQFFIVPDIQSEDTINQLDKLSQRNAIIEQRRTISQEIAKTTGINIFSRLDSKTRMFPSFSMMQEFLNAKFEEPVQITPTVGLSTFNDIINNGKTKTRDMALSFPDQALPDTVDNVAAPQEYDVTYHDFYHAFIASFIPKNHQEAFLQIGELLNEIRKKPDFKDIKAYLTTFRARLIDMEHASYRNDITPLNQETCQQKKFWSSINFAQHASLSMVHLKKAKSASQIFFLTQETAFRVMASNYNEVFAHHVIINKTALEKKGIDFTILEEFSKQIKKEIKDSIKQGLSYSKQSILSYSKKSIEETTNSIEQHLSCNKSTYNQEYKARKQMAYKMSIIIEISKQLRQNVEASTSQI